MSSGLSLINYFADIINERLNMYKSLQFLLFFVSLLYIQATPIDEAILKKAKEWIVFDDKGSPDETGTAQGDRPISAVDGGEDRKSKLLQTLRDLKKLIIQSDPLSKMRESGFRPIHLRLIKINHYKTRLSNTISYVWKGPSNTTNSFGVTYTPLINKEPFAHMKMDSWQIGLGMRKYIKDHFYIQGNLGYQIYRPNSFYSEYFQDRGTSFQDESIPYFTVGMGMRVLKSIPILKMPLVLRAEYTFSDDLNFPTGDPFGHDRIEVGGLKIGFSVRLKI